MAMSALLVGSTLLLTLYFRLPQALYGAGEPAAAGGAEYVDFANVVSIFWGIVMTLTLVAVYAPHAVALRSHAPAAAGRAPAAGGRERRSLLGHGEEGRGHRLGPRAAPGGADDATALMRVSEGELDA